jgi:hypothetical protein
MKIPKVLKVKAKSEKTVIEISFDFETSATANSSGRGVAEMKPASAGKIYVAMIPAAQKF